MCLKRLGGATHDRVLLRSLRRHLGSGGRLLASAPYPARQGCCPTSGSHSVGPGGVTADLFVVVVDAQVWDHPGPFEDYAQVL